MLVVLAEDAVRFEPVSGPKSPSEQGFFRLILDILGHSMPTHFLLVRPGSRKNRELSQFRPGQTGNPAGRPKKPKDMASMLKAESFAMTPGPDGRPVTGIERSLAALIENALSGDMAALKRILSRANEHGLALPHGRPEVSGVYTMPHEYFSASPEVQTMMFRAALHAKQREANGRFAKGSSGNPGGRPKVRAEETKVLERLLKQRTTILRHGRECSVTTAEALMHVLAEKAANGDIRAQDLGQTTLPGQAASRLARSASMLSHGPAGTAERAPETPEVGRWQV
jgi:hypothetical protein